jgi:hypothetical protein
VDKTFEVEVVRLEGISLSGGTVRIVRNPEQVTFIVESQISSIDLTLLPSEAVTIGEQLIAAGKAGEV